jgi:hypothetical protein
MVAVWRRDAREFKRAQRRLVLDGCLEPVFGTVAFGAMDAAFGFAVAFGFTATFGFAAAEAGFDVDADDFGRVAAFATAGLTAAAADRDRLLL